MQACRHSVPTEFSPCLCYLLDNPVGPVDVPCNPVASRPDPSSTVRLIPGSLSKREIGMDLLDISDSLQPALSYTTFIPLKWYVRVCVLYIIGSEKGRDPTNKA
jgi:hypothetical protein